MKIITISQIGYNHPSQANWNYGIYKLDFIDTNQKYCHSETIRETFGGNDRLTRTIEKKTGYHIIETKGVYTTTGTPKITGVTKLLDAENPELEKMILDFLAK